MNGVLPAHSVVMQEFNTRYGVVQLVLTIFLIASFFGQMLLGNAADRYGRRPVMIAGLIIFALGGFLCSLAPNIELLLAARFVQGFGASVCTFLPRAIVRDVFTRDKSASMIGYMTTAMMIAPMFGPMLGGWVTDNLSWRWLYAGLGFSGLLLTLMAYAFLNETLAERTDSSPRLSYFAASTALMKLRTFIVSALMMSGAIGMYYSFLAGAPYILLESRGLSASEYGMWFACVAIGYLSGNLIAGRFTEKYGVRRMIQIGYVPSVLGLVLFWVFSLWQHPLGLFIPMLLVALSNGISLPSMSVTAMSVREDLISSAAGLSGACQIAFGVLVTFILGIALPASDFWMLYVMSTCALIYFIGMWFGDYFKPDHH